MSTSWPSNRAFDPFAQEFNVLGPDGTTPISVPLSFAQQIQWNTVAGALCAGTQIGAATLLLLTLFLVTKRDKLRSLVFLLNALALLLVVIRGILEGISYTGPFYEWYRIAAVYYAQTPQARAVSACAELSSLLLYIVLELSLVFQVRIVCCTLEPIWKYSVNIFNTFVAILVIGARLGLAAITIKWGILQPAHETPDQFDRINRLGSAVSILFVVSVGISATIFSAKLAHAIHRRRLLGITQFGPMQIIFIMGCQTMVVPFIFILVCFYGITTIKMQSFAPAVVALLLPLSALWAAANVDNTNDNNVNRGDLRLAPFGRKDKTSGKAGGAACKSASDTSSEDGTIARASLENETGMRGSTVDLEKGKEGAQYRYR